MTRALLVVAAWLLVVPPASAETFTVSPGQQVTAETLFKAGVRYRVTTSGSIVGPHNTHDTFSCYEGCGPQPIGEPGLIIRLPTGESRSLNTYIEGSKTGPTGDSREYRFMLVHPEGGNLTFEAWPYRASTQGYSGQITVVIDEERPVVDYKLKLRGEHRRGAPRSLISADLQAKGKAEVLEDGAAFRKARAAGTAAIAIVDERNDSLTVFKVDPDKDAVYRETEEVRAITLRMTVKKSTLKGCRKGDGAELTLADAEKKAKDGAVLSWCGRTFRFTRPHSHDFSISVKLLD